MAISKDKKHEVVALVSQLLENSKMTVVTAYTGTPVKAMQQLRRDGRDNGTIFRVVKNRLIKKALSDSVKFKNVDTSSLEGMLLYAFNPNDEVAPAQTVANFAKTQPTLEFVGAFTADGQFMGADDVKSLASLPSKEQLRAQLVGTIGGPLSGFVNVMSGNLRGLLNVLSAKAEQS
jgi:large subunit ribosomal protein L10